MKNLGQTLVVILILIIAGLLVANQQGLFSFISDTPTTSESVYFQCPLTYANKNVENCEINVGITRFSGVNFDKPAKLYVTFKEVNTGRTLMSGNLIINNWEATKMMGWVNIEAGEEIYLDSVECVDCPDNTQYNNLYIE